MSDDGGWPACDFEGDSLFFSDIFTSLLCFTLHLILDQHGDDMISFMIPGNWNVFIARLTFKNVSLNYFLLAGTIYLTSS